MGCTSAPHAEPAAAAPSARTSRRLRATQSIISRRRSPIDFTFQFAEPAHLNLELLDGQADHPNRLMEPMANFLSNCAQCRLLPRQFAFQKLLPAGNLPQEHAGPRLPGERDPGEKWRPFALRGPILALESVGERRAALRCG